MVTYTSIQIYPETRELLAKLKSNKNESYDEVIRKLIELIPQGDEEGEYTEEFKIGLLNARLELKKGKKISLTKAKAKLGV
ncbi:MAG: hypothetical protein J7K73_03310 [Nanoarchaeota archaeon]|nr:hypothetical protein [Nanoarchaeota archaeon]